MRTWIISRAVPYIGLVVPCSLDYVSSSSSEHAGVQNGSSCYLWQHVRTSKKPTKSSYANIAQVYVWHYSAREACRT